MSLLRGLFSGLRALISRRRLDAEMDEELRFHMEMETEKNLRRGMPPAEARRQAMIAFGGVERFREQTREERGARPLEDLVADLRFALRTLRKSPGFTAVAFLSLAVGIGANTAVFSIVNSFLIRELPYQAPEELVNIYRDRARGEADPLNYPDFLEVREATGHLFSDLGGYQYALAQRQGSVEVEPVVVELVTGDYLSLLGIRPFLGRTILPEDHRAPGAHPVVMLGYKYWQDAFGGDPGVLGRQVSLSGRTYTVVGVAPPDFLGSRRGVAPQFFAPIMMINEIMPGGGDPLESRGTNAFLPVGRLEEGVTLAEVRTTLANVARELQTLYPGIWDQGDNLWAAETRDVIFDPVSDANVAFLNFLALGVVGLVLLIACSNLAAFLLARAVDRRKEVALRLSLGATRGRLVRQLLTEALVLAGLGGLAGLPLALWLLRVTLNTTLPFPIPLGMDLSLDVRVLSFTVLVSLSTGILVGLVPALRATRPELTPALKEGSGSGTGSGTLAMSRLLVTGQMAMAVVLLVVAGLFIRSFGASRGVDPGFGEEPSALLTFMMPAQEVSEEEGRVFLSAVMDQSRELPGVSRVAAISNIHLNPLNSMFLEVNVEGAQPPEGRSAHRVDFTSVTPGFFDAAGIPLLEGRDFQSSDREDGARVALVNRALAERFWPGGNALGQTIRIEIPGWEPVRVVGVVETASIHALAEAPTPFLYLPYGQAYNATVTLLAVGPDPRGTAGALFRMIRRDHPDFIIHQATTMEDHLGVLLIFSRLTALLSTIFAAMALGLALLGLYGVVSYAVARRSREMGIRISLGATPAAVVALQLRDGIRLVFLGSALGLLAGALVGRGMSGVLVGVQATDPLTLVGALAVLFLTALLSAWIPARRASRVEPARVLKAE